MEIIKQGSGILLSLSFALAYIPQIIRFTRTKSSKDVSLGMLGLNLLGYISGLVYVYTNGIAGTWVVINYTLGILMSIGTVSCWLYFIKE